MKKILLLVATLIAIVITYWLAISYFFPQFTDRGVFGESFGTLDTLFSGIALIGVVYALYLQQKQFVLQKEDSDKNLY